MNLAELFYNQVNNFGPSLIYNFLIDGEEQKFPVTYSGLQEKSLLVASELQKKYKPGDRAILLFDTSPEFAYSFWGCILSGIIAVPVNLPFDLRMLERLTEIIKDCQPSVIMTTSIISDRLAELPNIEHITVDNLINDLDFSAPVINENTPVLIQYTSGSVGKSRGVLLNHSNIMHNLAMLFSVETKPGIKHSLMTWLPLYHDMGLMSGIILPVYWSTHATLMSPLFFLQKPFRWLKALTEYKNTISAAPNFAFDLCCKSVKDEQLAKLDLSNWLIALNGAEAVRWQTIENFTEKFSICGFKPEYFLPAYGLAEATIFVSSTGRDKIPVVISVDKTALSENKVIISKSNENSVKLVSCGQARLDQKIAIVNHDTLELCPDSEIGEIWVSSPSVAEKYWNNPEASKAVFGWKIAGDSEAIKYMRSGDLGFTRENELFVTGRIKDLIIIRGRNYYPHHIEQTAENAHPFFRLGGCAAFAVERANEEKLVIIQEVKKGTEIKFTEEMVKSLKATVLEKHGVFVFDIVLLNPGAVFKTSSGKIQRVLCQKKYLNNELDLWNDQ
jgi:acyl-CoA synthetase (AMP-forming)/AMP-acid ligase II